MPSIEVGDVVEIGKSGIWEGCLLLVVEVRTWGVTGSVRGPGPAEYPMRVAYAEIVKVYRAIKENEDDGRRETPSDPTVV